jgi:hypothetical protein
MRKVISVAFREGESVYLKAAPETVRIVSGYLVRQKSVTYGLAKEGEETWHQESEIERIKGKVVVKGFAG